MNKNINLTFNAGEYYLDESLNPATPLKINGSITVHQSKYYCAYRTDHLFGFDGKNYMSELNANFEPIRHLNLLPEDNNTAIEDIRLFSFENTLMAVYTYLPIINNKWDWAYGVAIAEVELSSGLLKNQHSLRHLAVAKHEKNWTPYITGSRLFLVSNFQPNLRVIEVKKNPDSYEFIEVINQLSLLPCWKFGNLRGGAPFIASAENNWQYSFVHSSIDLPNGNGRSRFYFYTLLRLDLTKNLIQYIGTPLYYSKKANWVEGSRPAILNSKDINMSIKVVFPMGAIAYKNGVLLSFGKDDVTTRMKFYYWDYILGLFHDPDKVIKSHT